jgi:hypothetical protein
MCPRTRCSFLLNSRRLCELSLILIVSAFPILAAKTDNVVAAENISKSNRQELVRALRSITGWSDLNFDNNGALNIGIAGPRDGSKTARELLGRALTGDHPIVFVDAGSRKDVVFCRVFLRTINNEEVHVVEIDFADFRHVTGDKQALASFDVGWAVLHEIDHVVEDSVDPQENVIGDCEGRINGMRRELGLATRNSYFFSFLPVKTAGPFISRFVRMGFDQAYGPVSKRKRYWLIWDAAVVGGLPENEAADRVFSLNGRLVLGDLAR